MKKGFPKKIMGIPYGWQSKGYVQGVYVSPGVSRYRVHSYCNTTLKIGIENGTLFRYCPKCLIKADPLPK